MAQPAELEKLTGLASRFGAFVAERHPFALGDALDAFFALASIVAGVMYGKSFPVVALEPDEFASLRSGERLSVERSGVIRRTET